MQRVRRRSLPHSRQYQGILIVIVSFVGVLVQVRPTSSLVLSTSIRKTKQFTRPKAYSPSIESSALLRQSDEIDFNEERKTVVNSKRMSHEEQQDLLSKTVEMRRINAIRAELMSQSGGNSVLLVSLAKATGYGEELDLLESALAAGEAAREALVTGNMGLVHFCVNEIMSKRRNLSQLQSLSREDLIQEGAIGLARTVDRWNPAIGGKFSTYAVYWIRAAVLRCIAERDDFVRVPEHVSAAIRKIAKAAQTLGISIDEYDEASFISPQWKEAKAARDLAEEAGLTDRQLLEAMKVRERRKRGIMSYESWMQKKKDYETDSTLSLVTEGVECSNDSSSPTDMVQLKTELGKFLRPKEIEALSWRYGLHGRNYVQEAEQALFPNDSTTIQKKQLPVGGKWGEAMSFSEVGNQMHVSAEYGRKLCHAAIIKLQRAAEEGSLEMAYLC